MEIGDVSLDAMFGLDGKVAVVTGAGRGLGKRIAAALASAGATVVAADRDGEGAAQTVAELAAAGHSAVALPLDVLDEESVKGLFARVEAEVGQLAILVNNVGLYPKIPFLEVTVEDWDRLHDLNLKGTFLCMREGIRVMREHGGGRIVNISSIASVHPGMYDNATYAAAKAGVNGLTRAAALDFAADGIMVNSIAPGGITHENVQYKERDRTWRGPQSEGGRFLLGRAADPYEIAGLVLYLAGPVGGYVSGQTIVVDGGFLVS